MRLARDVPLRLKSPNRLRGGALRGSQVFGQGRGRARITIRAGKEPKGPATPGAKISYAKAPLTLKRPANLEDVAFWPIAHLAALIERKLVTSTDLTKMYIARLKRYQPTLNFYVTLTEELALKQAALAQLQAAVQSQASNLKLARITADRTKKLAEQGVVDFDAVDERIQGFQP